MAAPSSLHTQKSMLKKPGRFDGYSVFIEEYANRNGYDAPSLLKGGILWNRMSNQQKRKYQQRITRPKKVNGTDFVQGCCMKKTKRSCCPKPVCRRKPRCSAPRPKCCPKPRCAPKRKSCPKPRCAPKRRRRCAKVRCQKPGPVTNNGYLNFLRVYRRKHCGLKPKELVMRGARAWCRLSEAKKDRYRRQACKVLQKCRQKKRKDCKPCK